MCLFTRQILPIRAKKDIVVYKVLKHLGGYYRTPYRLVPMDIGNTYDASGDIKRYQALCTISTFDWNGEKIHVKRIYGGCIHSYTSLHEALHSVVWIFKVFPSVIVECVIPKGTLYYKSYDSCEIASRKLHIVKIVERS